MSYCNKKLIQPEYSDRIFKVLTGAAAILAALLMLGFFVQLFWYALPSIKTFGWRFLISSEWDPVKQVYGALPSILGTLITTGIAVLIAVPVSFIVSMFLVESAPAWFSVPVSYALDLLAAIPSIIYGMWGLFVFVPFMQSTVQPFLANTLHLKSIPFFGGNYNGFGFLTSGIILALMILPFVSAVMRDVFKMVPSVLKESAFGAGATSWEVTYDITMKYGARGLLGAVFLGLGRAVGETMAVLFVIGNIQTMPKSFFQAGTTIAATLANNFAEAEGIFKSSLFELGLILLVMSFLIQVLAQLWLKRISRQMGES
ncbi:MAG: phosphate ABC transporter permease subunit PstC [Lentisphaerae bacterium]|nr:phosphate ABC transporter permease subunit PstC [Lentisphaerota bacterium]MCP4101210.1 phosphate ABC transporter permease subunit PstC [Lentisphaerota bacterium]